MKQELLDTQEAATYLTLSKSYLEKLRVSGDGPKFYRLGAAIRYKSADLEQWLDSCLRTSTSDDGSHVKRTAR